MKTCKPQRMIGMWQTLRAISSICILIVISSFVQAQENLGRNPFFIEPEVVLGKAGNGYRGFPKTGIRATGQVSFGVANTKGVDWAKYFNSPHTGVSTSFSTTGNVDILGYEISVVPYVLFNPIKKLKRPFYLKIGLGASYFTKHYNATTNRENKAISSPVSWAYQMFAYQSLYISERMNWKLGVGWTHASTGHISLPNFGLNSFSASLAVQVFTKPNGPVVIKGEPLEKLPKVPNRYTVNVRHGFGFHALGGTGPESDNIIKPVYALAISGGIIVNRFVKIKLGVSYRFYQHFHDYLLQEGFEQYIDQPVVNTSAVSIFFGPEFLLGHVGLDIEVGINVHNPFYKQYYDDFKPGPSEGFGYVSKNLISQRIGFNVYLFNVKKSPVHNVSLGAHINVNFGEADFSEFSLSYTWTIIQKKETDL
jgi:hypothetical protein